MWTRKLQLFWGQEVKLRGWELCTRRTVGSAAVCDLSSAARFSFPTQAKLLLLEHPAAVGLSSWLLSITFSH